MSLLVSRSRRYGQSDALLDNPPFPWAGAALGMIAVVNVASLVAMLLSV
jgi:hypothetical protein